LQRREPRRAVVAPAGLEVAPVRAVPVDRRAGRNPHEEVLGGIEEEGGHPTRRFEDAEPAHDRRDDVGIPKADRLSSAPEDRVDGLGPRVEQTGATARWRRSDRHEVGAEELESVGVA
jgi:hypothetical protein